TNQAFDEIVGRKPSPNFPALDEALIRTVSDWKRLLSAELKHAVPNASLSALFNAILFSRAAEDYGRHLGDMEQRLLLEAWSALPEGNLANVLETTLSRVTDSRMPSWILDKGKLEV